MAGPLQIHDRLPLDNTCQNQGLVQGQIRSSAGSRLLMKHRHTFAECIQLPQNKAARVRPIRRQRVGGGKEVTFKA